MKTNAGGPAFPVEFSTAGWHSGNVNVGMTLRDWFAGQAPQLPSYLQDVVPFNTPNPAEGDAKWRYIWADSMLKAREQ